MATRGGAVHVATTRRTYKGRVYESHLLRRSYRVGDKVRNETVGNLSHLPASVIEIVRRSLRGEAFVPADEAIGDPIASPAHGAARAVLTAMRRLGVASLLTSRPCREADLVMAMVAARIIAPDTKLATTRWWPTTTLAADLGVADANEDELYEAMDWLLGRQHVIEKKLAARHLNEKDCVLYDLTSSYFEGTTCPLGKRGHNRDGKKGKLQVNYGMLTDARGCPVAVSVYDGNTSDAKTLLPQVRKMKDEFGLGDIILVGDRGMISHKIVAELQTVDGLRWITALKSVQIRKLVEDGRLQLGLFDKRNLFEIAHPDYPGERLVACRNPELAKLRAHTRVDLIAATVTSLEKVQAAVHSGRLRGAAKIGVRVGRVINKYRVAKHFVLDIKDDAFDFQVAVDNVAAEAALDGIYVIRTSVAKRRMDAAEAVRSYKLLSNVERAFRCMKTIDLKVRPIHHRLADRVRGHIFLCMLAYYVEWHMREAWRPILFADEDLAAKKRRDPVAPAHRSEAADTKAASHITADGEPVHSFRTILQDLARIVRNVHAIPGVPEATFTRVTTPDHLQSRAFDLLETIAA